jgi:hypothetical protein
VRPLTITIAEYEGLNPDGDPTYPVVRELERVTHTAMAPARIRDMHERGCEVVSAEFNRLPREFETELHAWLKIAFTKSSASALYGHDNPIKSDHSLIQALE